MKNLFKLQLTIIIILMSSVSALACNSVDEIKTTLNNRSESVSHDARRDIRRGGIKIGCRGNTFKAEVRAINPEVAEGGSNLEIKFKYDGKYKREKFDRPCVRVATERKNLTGIYHIILKPSLLGKPQVVEERIENFGEVSDPNHDSNKFAKLAARKIITKACEF